MKSLKTTTNLYHVLSLLTLKNQSGEETLIYIRTLKIVRQQKNKIKVSVGPQMLFYDSPLGTMRRQRSKHCM